jgi:hypothetical protein
MPREDDEILVTITHVDGDIQKHRSKMLAKYGASSRSEEKTLRLPRRLAAGSSTYSGASSTQRGGTSKSPSRRLSGVISSLDMSVIARNRENSGQSLLDAYPLTPSRSNSGSFNPDAGDGSTSPRDGHRNSEPKSLQKGKYGDFYSNDSDAYMKIDVPRMKEGAVQNRRRSSIVAQDTLKAKTVGNRRLSLSYGIDPKTMEARNNFVPKSPQESPSASSSSLPTTSSTLPAPKFADGSVQMYVLTNF